MALCFQRQLAVKIGHITNSREASASLFLLCPQITPFPPLQELVHWLSVDFWSAAKGETVVKYTLTTMIASLIMTAPSFAQGVVTATPEAGDAQTDIEHFVLRNPNAPGLDLPNFARNIEGPVAVTSTETSEAEIETIEIGIGGPYYASEEDAWRDADLYATPDN